VGDDDDEVLCGGIKLEEGKLDRVASGKGGSWPRTPLAARVANREGSSGAEKTDAQSLNCRRLTLILELSIAGLRGVELG